MKYFILIIACFCSSFLYGQRHSVSTNGISWGTLSLNAEYSARIGYKQSVHVPFSWNPWIFGGNKKMKHFTVSPQWRYWKTEVYLGHFLGANLIGSRYNVSRGSYRFDGGAYGVGSSWGYAWLLNKRLNLEVQAGIGVVRTDYKRFDCGTCGDYLSKESKWFLVPNRLAVSLVYVL